MQTTKTNKSCSKSTELKDLRDVHQVLRKAQTIPISRTYMLPQKGELRSTDKEVAAEIEHRYAEMDEHIVAYASGHCKEWCALMQKKLPVELKDMIYHYLMPSHAITINWKDLNMIESHICDKYIEKHTGQQKYSRVFSYLIPATHLFDNRFADPRTRTEFVEAWYKFVTFRFNGESRLLPRLMKCDRWGLGVELGSLIRNIEITTTLWDLNNFLKSLLKLRSTSKIALTILKWVVVPDLLSQNRYEWGMDAFTGTLFHTFPDLVELCQAGHAITVKCAGTGYESIRLTVPGRICFNVAQAEL